jgi:hypothetical protein
MSRLSDYTRTVMGCAPAALTSTAGDGRYVSFRNARKMRITLSILNASTVTGGTVTLKQAKAVAGMANAAGSVIYDLYDFRDADSTISAIID